MSTTTDPATSLSARPGEVEKAEYRVGRLAAAGVTVALVAVLVLLFAAMIFPALTGRTPMTILTGSMAPSLPPGHIAVYGPADPASLKVGDVIAYRPDTGITDGMPITHRIIAIDHLADRIIVQGDAVPYPDAPLRPDQVMGRMDYFIPYAGILKVFAFQVGLGPILPVFSGGLLAYWLWLTIGGLLPDRKVAD